MAVNKTDDKRTRQRAGEFHRLGFEPVVEISAEHGDGVAELLDEVRTPAAGREAGGGRRGRAGNRRRHRRPAERGEVVAGQPAACGRSA